jgi:hypothetical protein
LTEKLLDRIGALLAKAESTDSLHEAEALVAKAQQLATLHAVDLAAARQRTQRKHRREQVTQRKLTLARRPGPGLRHQVLLFVTIAHVNDVQVDIARNSTYVLAFGFPSDIDVVEAMHASLATQMIAGATAAIRRGDHKEDLYWSDAAGGWRSDARVFRSNFNDGFVTAIGERLRDARAKALAEHDAQPEHAAAARSSGAELVLVEKAQEVAAFHQTHSDARGSWTGAPRAGAPWSPGGHRAGHRAGHQARLGGQRSIGGARGALPQR